MKEINREKIGKRIRQLMKEKNIPVKDLASALNCHPDTIYKWGRGERLPKNINLAKIADILGVSLDYLVHGEKLHLVEEEIFPGYSEIRHLPLREKLNRILLIVARSYGLEGLMTQPEIRTAIHTEDYLKGKISDQELYQRIRKFCEDLLEKVRNIVKE